LTEPSQPQEIRRGLNLSQAAFAGPDGGKFADGARLGTRAASTEWAGQIAITDSGTASGSIYEVGVKFPVSGLANKPLLREQPTRRAGFFFARPSFFRKYQPGG
jgi:hypothetical protein